MVIAPFLSCVFLYIWDQLMNYTLKWVFSIMLQFKILINNNNGGLGDCPQSHCKFILSQRSPEKTFLLHLLSNQCMSCQQSRSAIKTSD